MEKSPRSAYFGSILVSGGSSLGQIWPLGGSWELFGHPLWDKTQKCLKKCLKLRQNGPKRRPKGAKVRPGCPKMSPRSSKGCLGEAKMRSKREHGSILGGSGCRNATFVILAPLCSENLTFEGLSVQSGSHLGSKMTSGGGQDRLAAGRWLAAGGLQPHQPRHLPGMIIRHGLVAGYIHKGRSAGARLRRQSAPRGSTPTPRRSSKREPTPAGLSGKRDKQICKFVSL